MRFPGIVMILTLTSLLPAVRAFGESVVAGHDWDSESHNWTSEYGWTTQTHKESGGNPDGWLEIQFPQTTKDEVFDFGEEWYDIVYTSADDLFAGTWTTEMGISFDFWASNQTPNQLQVQWKSSTNENVWGYVLDPDDAVLGGWTGYSASLADWEDWKYTGADEEQYLNDLLTIDWVGIYVWREESDQEFYGLDDFNLTIPEPAEVVMLACAVWFALLSVRRREYAAIEAS